MEELIIALIRFVGLPLLMRVVARETPQKVAEAEMQAAYTAEKLAADAAAKAIIEAP